MYNLRLDLESFAMIKSDVVKSQALEKPIAKLLKSQP